MSIYSEPVPDGKNAQDVGLHRERDLGGVEDKRMGEQEVKGDSHWEIM